jgi:VIT1/CCC1 family predicted Fe2+/Mn2+ transporter
MEHSWKIGVCFGLTSAIITTLGLIVGLHSGTHSKTVVLGGILTIAIADAFSDALGIHVSEESELKHTKKEIWMSTASTFLSKFFALTFIVPILLFELSTAIVISIAWGLIMLAFLSLTISREKKENPWESIAEHLIIALVVILITHFVGEFIASMFV